MAVRVLGGLVGVGVVAAGAVVASKKLAEKKTKPADGDEAAGAIPMRGLPAAAAAAGDDDAAPSAPPLELAGAPADPILVALGGNESLLSPKGLALVRELIAEGQAHIFAAWPPPGSNDADKYRLIGQLAQLDSSYHGGLVQYIRNAKQLLRDSKEGHNPFEGFSPSVPEGEALDFASDRFLEFEARGARAASDAAFVLVAGGLGERLGYSGIKVALPAESASGRSFLQLYCEFILTLQAKSKAGKPLPLAIMTSDDTHARTQALLETHNNFGMAPGQITLMKQEKVACLTDNDAHLALDPRDPFAIQTKPHGHGDVHALLHSTGMAKKWRKEGRKWVCFFQDTNALVFRALPLALGVSAACDYDMNSMAVPRKAKESIGAIARLVSSSDPSRSTTVNVEYNQLDPLLRATVAPEGDVNDPKTGFSPYPGNINQIVIKLDSYVKQLDKTGGIISEFVNPKYADATRTAFKSSTRLECMMQDYPKALGKGAKVGFTVVNQVWATYSPVKNSVADARAKAAEGNPTHSATAAEMDFYKAGAVALRDLAAADIGAPQPGAYNGIPVEEYPRVVLAPSFAPTLGDVKAKVSARGVVLAPRSVLVLDGADIRIKNLRLSGALVVRAAPGARVVIDGLTVGNAGWEWAHTEELPDVTEEEAIRGFRVVKRETAELTFDAPGDYLIPEAGARARASDDEEAEEGAPEAEGAVAADPAAAAAVALAGAGSGSLRRVPSRGGAVAAAVAAMERTASLGNAASPPGGLSISRRGSGGVGGGGGDEEEEEEARAAAHQLTEAVFASVAGAK